jgi:hypothetical protein
VVQLDCKAYTAAVQINPQEPGYLNNVGNTSTMLATSWCGISTSIPLPKP